MTTAVDAALSRLQTEEGFRANSYRDTRGFLTIGYGFNVDAGITQAAAAALLSAQANEVHVKLMAYAWYAGLDSIRQSVCLDIAFNGGIGDLLHYPHMISAIQESDWETAAAECASNDPALKGRYQVLSKIMLSGQLA